MQMCTDLLCAGFSEHKRTHACRIDSAACTHTHAARTVVAAARGQTTRRRQLNALPPPPEHRDRRQPPPQRRHKRRRHGGMAPKQPLQQRQHVRRKVRLARLQRQPDWRDEMLQAGAQKAPAQAQHFAGLVRCTEVLAHRQKADNQLRGEVPVRLMALAGACTPCGARD